MTERPQRHPHTESKAARIVATMAMCMQAGIYDPRSLTLIAIAHHDLADQKRRKPDQAPLLSPSSGSNLD